MRSEAELKETKERLLAMTNHNQHVENCLRSHEQRLTEANSCLSQLEEEYRVTKEQLNSEVMSVGLAFLIIVSSNFY